MVTDGVLDAFGEEPGEEILKEWILQAQEQMPKELGRYLLEKHYSMQTTGQKMT